VLTARGSARTEVSTRVVGIATRTAAGRISGRSVEAKRSQDAPQRRYTPRHRAQAPCVRVDQGGNDGRSDGADMTIGGKASRRRGPTESAPM